MASNHSYTITFDNNRTEKEGIDYVLSMDQKLINPTKESRKELMEALSIEKNYARAFDLIWHPIGARSDGKISLDSLEDLVLIELKTTKKKLPENPYGFFWRN